MIRPRLSGDDQAQEKRAIDAVVFCPEGIDTWFNSVCVEVDFELNDIFVASAFDIEYAVPDNFIRFDAYRLINIMISDDDNFSSSSGSSYVSSLIA